MTAAGPHTPPAVPPNVAAVRAAIDGATPIAPDLPLDLVTHETAPVLARLAAGARLHWRGKTGEFKQVRLFTGLRFEMLEGPAIGAAVDLIQAGAVGPTGDLTDMGRALAAAAAAAPPPKPKDPKGKKAKGPPPADDGTDGDPGPDPDPRPDPPRGKDTGKGASKGGGGKGGGGPATPAADDARWDLPPGSPITPLGKLGDILYFLDANHQLRPVKSKDLARSIMLDMAGTRIGWLYDTFPRLNQHGEPTGGWKPEELQACLARECAKLGLWDPLHRVREQGTWLDEDGRLVVHYGDAIWHAGAWHRPGRIGDHVYPATPTLPRPAEAPPVYGAGGAAATLLRWFESWSWARPIDAKLLLGWCVAAVLGGALDWRPVCWITGDKGTGKSTLQRLVKSVLGDWMRSTAEATQASLYQANGRSTRAVALDEAEAEDDNQRLLSVVKLARIAASGGQLMRGGQDGQATEYQIRAAYLFSSILLPPLAPQDRSRIAQLDLRPRTPGSRPPAPTAAELRAIGAAFRRQIVDGWPGWTRIAAAYRDALLGLAHDDRAVDVYGTLLGCAELALAGPDADVQPAAIEPDLSDLSADDIAARVDTAADHEQLCQWLRSVPVDAWKGGMRMPLGHHMGELVRLWRDNPDHMNPQKIVDDHESSRVLGTHGMRLLVHAQVIVDGAPIDIREPWLVVHNTSAGLHQLMRRDQVKWAGGVWRQSLRRVPGALTPDGTIKIRDVGPGRATLVPLDALVELDDTPMGV